MNRFTSFLGILKSACNSQTKSFISPCNKKVKKLCLVLEELGYIYGFTILNENYIQVFLKFYSNKSVLRSVNLVSRSSLRVYFKLKNLKGLSISNYINQNSFTILSVSKTNLFITDLEALMLKTGGEPVCTII